MAVGWLWGGCCILSVCRFSDSRLCGIVKAAANPSAWLIYTFQVVLLVPARAFCGVCLMCASRKCVWTADSRTGHTEYAYLRLKCAHTVICVRHVSDESTGGSKNDWLRNMHIVCVCVCSCIHHPSPFVCQIKSDNLTITYASSVNN